MSDKDKTFVVRVFFVTGRDAGQTFGPFRKRETAEACVVEAVKRPDVLSAAIEESD